MPVPNIPFFRLFNPDGSVLNEWVLSEPMLPPIPSHSHQGGQRRTASGQRAVYLLRTDEFVELTLRLNGAREEWVCRLVVSQLQTVPGVYCHIFPDFYQFPAEYWGPADLESPDITADLKCTRDASFSGAWLSPALRFRHRLGYRWGSPSATPGYTWGAVRY